MLNQVKNPIRYKINSWHNDQHLVNLRVNQQFFNIIKIFKVWVQLSGPHLDFEIVDFRVDHFFTIFCFFTKPMHLYINQTTLSSHFKQTFNTSNIIFFFHWAWQLLGLVSLKHTWRENCSWKRGKNVHEKTKRKAPK